MDGGGGVVGVRCVWVQIKGLTEYKPGVTGLNLSEFSQQFNCMCYYGLHVTVKSIIKIENLEESTDDITSRTVCDFCKVIQYVLIFSMKSQKRYNRSLLLYCYLKYIVRCQDLQ